MDSFLIVTLVIIAFILIINVSTIHSKQKLIINGLLLIQSISLIIDKTIHYPWYMGVVVFFMSLSFILYSIYKEDTSQLLDYKVLKGPNLQTFGFLSLFFYFLTEFFIFDGNIQENGYLIIIFSLFCILINYFPPKYINESFFIFYFLLFFTFLSVFPDLVYKFNNVLFNFADLKSFLTANFLTKPTVTICLFFGLKVQGNGAIISYQDTVLGHTVSLQIEEQCSGITSIILFISAFLAYAINSKMDELSKFSFLIIGISFAYFSNLFRMAMLVIIGHYYGLDQLLWVHKNLGWLLFTVWIFLFFNIYFYIERIFLTRPS